MADYPAISDPTTDAASLRDSVIALKQGFEILTGQRGNGDNAAVVSKAVKAPDLSGLLKYTPQTLGDTDKAQARANIGAISAADIAAAFPSGTVMLFVQTSAPTGWTKSTAHNDKALRVVSGAASSGGTNAFSTVMAQTVVGSHALTIGEIPAHAHSYTASPQTGPQTEASVTVPGAPAAEAVGSTTGSAGSGGAHNHSITMAMQYVDAIIASKD